MSVCDGGEGGDGGDGGDGCDEGGAVPGVTSHLSSPACQNTGEFGNKLLHYNSDLWEWQPDSGHHRSS